MCVQFVLPGDGNETSRILFLRFRLLVPGNAFEDCISNAKRDVGREVSSLEKTNGVRVFHVQSEDDVRVKSVVALSNDDGHRRFARGVGRGVRWWRGWGEGRRSKPRRNK